METNGLNDFDVEILQGNPNMRTVYLNRQQPTKYISNKIRLDSNCILFLNLVTSQTESLKFNNLMHNFASSLLHYCQIS